MSSTRRRLRLRPSGWWLARLPNPFAAKSAFRGWHSKSSAAGLKRLARDLMDRPGFNLEIQARVDSAGPEAFNFMLTQARAAAVRDYLVEEGVSAERLIARGFGSEPIPQANGQLIAFVVRR